MRIRVGEKVYEVYDVRKILLSMNDFLFLIGCIYKIILNTFDETDTSKDPLDRYGWMPFVSLSCNRERPEIIYFNSIGDESH